MRGLNNPSKNTIVRNVIRAQHANVIGLTETKLKDVSISKVNALCGDSTFDFISTDESNDSSRGQF